MREERKRERATERVKNEWMVPGSRLVIVLVEKEVVEREVSSVRISPGRTTAAPEICPVCVISFNVCVREPSLDPLFVLCVSV